MNIFSLVLKQMRQRALSTWLTLLSVTLGVALAITILVLYREAGHLFGQTDYGFDVLVGPKGSATQLVMNTIYQVDQSPGNVPFSLYRDLTPQAPVPPVRAAWPCRTWSATATRASTASSARRPTCSGTATTGRSWTTSRCMEYRPDERYAFAAGHDFLPHKFEAIVGSDVAKETNLKIGVTFRATHGLPQPGQTPDIHKTVWTVVGILGPHAHGQRPRRVPAVREPVHDRRARDRHAGPDVHPRGQAAAARATWTRTTSRSTTRCRTTASS